MNATKYFKHSPPPFNNTTLKEFLCRPLNKFNPFIYKCSFRFSNNMPCVTGVTEFHVFHKDITRSILYIPRIFRLLNFMNQKHSKYVFLLTILITSFDTNTRCLLAKIIEKGYLYNRIGKMISRVKREVMEGKEEKHKKSKP